MATQVGASVTNSGPTDATAQPTKRVVLHVPAGMTELVQTSTPSAGSEVSATNTFRSDMQTTPVSATFSATESAPPTSPIRSVHVKPAPFVPPPHASAPANDGIMWGQKVKEGPLKWRNSSGKLVDIWAICKDWALEIFPSKDRTAETDRLFQINLISTRSMAVKVDPERDSKDKRKALAAPKLLQPGDPRAVLNVNTKFQTCDVPFVVRALPSIQACSTNISPPSLSSATDLASPAAVTPSGAEPVITKLADISAQDDSSLKQQSSAAGIQPLIVEQLAYDPLMMPSKATSAALPATFLTGRPSIVTPSSTSSESATMPSRAHRGTVAVARNAVVESVAAAAVSSSDASSSSKSASQRFTSLIMQANPGIDVFTAHGQALGGADEVDPVSKLAFFVVISSQGKRGLHTFAASTSAERAAWLFVLHRLRRFDSGGLPLFLSLTGDEWVNTDLSLSANAPGAGAQPSYLLGSMDCNTKKSGFLKSAVSKKKRRFCLDGFDLDLTYITGRIIAMGFPSIGREAIYRNDKDDVIRFLETRHPGHYKVYNLCSERPYNKDIFPELLHFPFDDHNPPCFEDILFCIRDLLTWLQANPQNIAAIHCKAGKGRTGLIIVALLLYIGMWECADEALSYYAFVRTKNQKGVTIPSQIRWIYMFEAYLKLSRNRLRELRSIHTQIVQGGATASAVSTNTATPATSTAATPAVTTNTTLAANPRADVPQPTAGDLSPLLPGIQLPFRLPPMEAFESAMQFATGTRNPRLTVEKISSLPTPYSEAVSLFSATRSSGLVQPIQSPSLTEAKTPAESETKASVASDQAATNDTTTAADEDDFLEIPNQPVKELKISRNSPFYAALSEDETTIGLPARHTKYVTQFTLSPSAPSHDSFTVYCDGCALSSTQLPIVTVSDRSKSVPEGRCKKTKLSNGQIIYDIPIGLIPVEGDFYIEFEKKKFFGGVSKPFSFWLHTQFTSFVGEEVVMTRQQLDKAAKKKKGKPFEVTVKLHDPMPHIKAPKARWSIVAAPTTTASTTESKTDLPSSSNVPESSVSQTNPTASPVPISSSPTEPSGESQSASTATSTPPPTHVVKLHVPSNF